jgi:hypothetical protein
MTSAEDAKLVTVVEAYTKEEQRSVIRFLVSKGNKPIEIYHGMELQYCKAFLFLQQVNDWGRKFKNEVPSVTDATRPG